MKRKYFFYLLFLIIAILSFVAYKQLFNARPTQSELEKEYWWGYEIDGFMLFINFSDSTKPDYCYTKKDSIFENGVLRGKIVSYNRITKILKVKSLSKETHNKIFSFSSWDDEHR